MGVQVDWEGMVEETVKGADMEVWVEDMVDLEGTMAIEVRRAVRV